MTLPNFAIIGVAKGGTTSLYRYLEQHPEVYMCPVKGTNFFGYQDALDWRWPEEGDPPKLRHFQATTLADYEALFAGATDEIAIGEASPQYLHCPTAARRIREAIPDIKLIASLRNPADRAWSGFLMRTRRGEAVESAYLELTRDSSHVKEGFYYHRMKRYFDNFAREQIKVFLFEDFKRDTSQIVVELLDFLGVDNGFVPDTSTRHNTAGVPKNRLLNRIYFNPKVVRTASSILPDSMKEVAKGIRQRNLETPPQFPADLRAQLLRGYREDILRLQDLIDIDLSGWLEPIEGRRERQLLHEAA
jgi:hypothetical protein